MNITYLLFASYYVKRIPERVKGTKLSSAYWIKTGLQKLFMDLGWPDKRNVPIVKFWRKLEVPR